MGILGGGASFLFGAAFLGFMGKILKCILLIVVGILANYILKSGISKILKRTQTSYSDRKIHTIATLASHAIKYIIYFVVIIEILQIFGIDPRSILTIAGVLSVAVGFGAQSLVKDIITGFFILLEDQFAIGDIVSIEGKSGKVESMSLRTIRVRSGDGDLHIIPNGEIKIVTNMTHGFNRAVVDLSVAYSENIEQVISVLEDEMSLFSKENTKIINKPNVLGITAFGNSAIELRIVADCAVNENWGIEREMRKRIKLRFDKEGISVPYPQSIVNVKN